MGCHAEQSDVSLFTCVFEILHFVDFSPLGRRRLISSLRSLRTSYDIFIGYGQDDILPKK